MPNPPYLVSQDNISDFFQPRKIIGNQGIFLSKAARNQSLENKSLENRDFFF